MKLGEINLKKFLEEKKGIVYGELVQDAKLRWYTREYEYAILKDNKMEIWPKGKVANKIVLPTKIILDSELVTFFGLYSGDGAKGTEIINKPGRITTSISFSQKEPHLIKFAINQFRKIFGDNIWFDFSLGEDSAYFMDEDGHNRIKSVLNDDVPLVMESLNELNVNLSAADIRYLNEQRNVSITNEEALAFHYQYNNEMQKYLIDVKMNDLNDVGITLGPNDRVNASLRRPFKKGARTMGGSSRSDELYVKGVSLFGELFLKILHSIEESILNDTQESTDTLIKWDGKPSTIGEVIDLKNHFLESPYAEINGSKPILEEEALYLIGKYPRGSLVKLNKRLRQTPLWLYAAGLYLAEGSTAKEKMFQMYTSRARGLSLSFTSSEPYSLEIIIKALELLFFDEQILSSWKVKVGSQYFPELVTTGLKLGVPMLRGGLSGDGKLRTMEISLSIKRWALEIVPFFSKYEDRFSHVEPTGAGVARIDFSGSSKLCKWYFGLIIYSAFKNTTKDPKGEF
uniref:BseYIA n=1 Tax=Bacillus sp. 2521 TaxID=925413 RepID=E5LGC2_9BACI|nr:BseYIA [Bacillus sp. 2521]